MVPKLTVSSGHYSDKGRKAINQDALSFTVPNDTLLNSKGIVCAIADGISTSSVSQVASQAVTQGLAEDYFCSAETWSVKKSGLHVITALNAWLFSQTQKSEFRFEREKGYVCTLSAVILKSTTAHWFHVGDSRIYLLRNNELTQLTCDHRQWHNEKDSYLSRAMGVQYQLEIDYGQLALQENDVLLLMTDGVYEFVSEQHIIDIITYCPDSPSTAAQQIAELAYKHNSDDNLSIQVVCINSLPELSVNDKLHEFTELAKPPILQVRDEFDGYLIVKNIHASSRSHVYLARPLANKEGSPLLVLKTPSIDLSDDVAYLERFLQEEWIARRINNPHVLKPHAQSKQRQYLYTVFEYVEGQTLYQWMLDNPSPTLEIVRGIIEQIAVGLSAFHRLEMLHQDLRPQNIMIDTSGMVKIIDFGSTKVAGLAEISSPFNNQLLLGTAQYSAPEYFLGEAGCEQSDQFSLAVIAYQMLTGNLPYGAKVAQANTRAAQRKLRYQSVLHDEKAIPAWVDATLKKALHPNPFNRYHELSEFIYDLRYPNKSYLAKTRPPLAERDPVAFWQSVSLILCLVILYLLSV
ncbi:MAG: bifunctional protein-serine/threonine kinase/phosphatase [Paraglaciecola sp.]|nr:bifunctional protein-serine/threonine kinase/phosphatase [Paraglaciecola sp.]